VRASAGKYVSLRRRPFTRRSVVVAGLLVLSACTTSVTPKPLRTSSQAPEPNLSVTRIPEPNVSASKTSTALNRCPGSEAFTRLPAFALLPGAPDDLLTLADGTMWVSDPVRGMLRHLSSSGTILQSITDPEMPEGIALLPDGRLAVAEQRLNRVVTLRPPSTSRTTLFELPSAGAAAGLDGIAFDRGRGALLVPDSPHGTLLTWSFPNGPLRTIARGLGRAVDAGVGPDGAIYVTSEAARGLLRIENGAGVEVDAIAQADDVVGANGLLYVTLIDAGEVLALDPGTESAKVLVTGIRAAQGLTVLRDGRLAIADSNRGVIALARACS
jgi:sugar lactone lactonase YvrE